MHTLSVFCQAVEGVRGGNFTTGASAAPCRGQVVRRPRSSSLQGPHLRNTEGSRRGQRAAHTNIKQTLPNEGRVARGHDSVFCCLGLRWLLINNVIATRSTASTCCSSCWRSSASFVAKAMSTIVLVALNAMILFQEVGRSSMNRKSTFITHCWMSRSAFAHTRHHRRCCA